MNNQRSKNSDWTVLFLLPFPIILFLNCVEPRIGFNNSFYLFLVLPNIYHAFDFLFHTSSSSYFFFLNCRIPILKIILLFPGNIKTLKKIVLILTKDGRIVEELGIYTNSVYALYAFIWRLRLQYWFQIQTINIKL